MNRTYREPVSWDFDPQIRNQVQSNVSYQLLHAPQGCTDIAKVVNSYRLSPVPGYDIAMVEVIHNPNLERSFASALVTLERRHDNPAFQPHWEEESNPELRRAVHQKFRTWARGYQDPTAPHIDILPLWHGTRPEVRNSVCHCGYAALGSTDDGYFGRGVYSSVEASYAHRVYSKEGVLIVNWVAIGSAYPVIDGDMPKLRGKAHYQNYDTHVVPVKPADPDNPNEVNYYPCGPDDVPQYHEVVVFDHNQCLPRYLVRLQPSLPDAPSIMSSSSLMTPTPVMPAVSSRRSVVNRPRLILHMDASFVCRMLVQHQSYWLNNASDLPKAFLNLVKFSIKWNQNTPMTWEKLDSESSSFFGGCWLKKSPDDVGHTLVRSWLNMVQSLRRGDIESANGTYRTLEEALMFDVLRRGLAHWDKGQKKEALSCFNRGLESRPQNPETVLYWRRRACIHRENMDFNRACSDLAYAVEIDPENPAARFDYGEMLIFSERYPEALEQFRALRACPGEDRVFRESSVKNYELLADQAIRKAQSASSSSSVPPTPAPEPSSHEDQAREREEERNLPRRP